MAVIRVGFWIDADEWAAFCRWAASVGPPPDAPRKGPGTYRHRLVRELIRRAIEGPFSWTPPKRTIIEEAQRKADRTGKPVPLDMEAGL